MNKVKVLFAVQTVTAVTTGVVLGTFAASYVVTHVATSTAAKIIGGTAAFVVTSLIGEKVAGNVINPLVNLCISDQDVRKYYESQV
jgi:hypothetical protein